MQAPYHIIPILLLSLGAYLVSSVLVKAGMLTRITHRKIWNTLLLISFLACGILGILLAVRVNYKLEWPWLETMMKWHVDAGILLSVVAAIHLGWHLSWYLKIFRKENPSNNATHPIIPDAALIAAPQKLKNLALMLGFFTMVVQVLLIREITTVFQGNEVMMAWTLAAWMFLTGIGSWLGRSFRKGSPMAAVTRVFLMMAFLPR